MKKYPFVVWMAALVVLVVLGCEKTPTEEAAPAEVAPEETAKEAPPSGEAEAVTPELSAERPSEARAMEPLALPVGWVEVEVTSPKGVEITMGVPAEWVVVEPPNPSTLAVRGARYERKTDGGTQVSVVAVDFDGDIAALADQTRLRTAGLATIEREGPVRFGTRDAYEVVARWATAMGEKETKQLMTVVGEEAIGINCQLLPGKLAELEGLCDEIFATVKLDTP